MIAGQHSTECAARDRRLNVAICFRLCSVQRFSLAYALLRLLTVCGEPMPVTLRKLAARVSVSTSYGSPNLHEGDSLRQVPLTQERNSTSSSPLRFERVSPAYVLYNCERIGRRRSTHQFDTSARIQSSCEQPQQF